ncbi:MAG: RluA family pseudouridine synthase [Bifidobacteriaceae bacterium]|jgi:23S rRNA pseudouridine1911/1915/1917 synthase|nr:RluA family pseudouridine synthase [Bifidobacteriaceae bacterium]
MTRLVPVPEGLAGERADSAVARLMGLSRAKAAELAAAGRITVDGAPVGKSARLTGGALLEIDLPEAGQASAEATVELPIAYEDADLVVVDKPVGVAAHRGPGWDGPTVLGSLLAQGVAVARGGPNERRGIVQRLDVGTSGLMMVAKSERAYSVLKQMFRDRAVHKVYHALAQGLPDPLRGTIDGPVGRLPGAFKFGVVEGGKPSITHYEVLEAFAGAALLRVELETGRTHQIRVHLAAMGHPLAGDPFYGADPRLAERLGLERQWLHAVALELDHPVTGLPLRVESDYPEDLAAALAVLRDV